MGLLPLPLSFLLAVVPGSATPGVSVSPTSPVPMSEEVFATVLIEGGLPDLKLACEESANFGVN